MYNLKMEELNKDNNNNNKGISSSVSSSNLNSKSFNLTKEMELAEKIMIEIAIPALIKDLKANIIKKGIKVFLFQSFIIRNS